MQVGIVARAGEVGTATILVASPKAERNRIRATLVDFTRDAKGKIVELKEPHPRSARSWLEIGAPEFETPEKGRVPVQLAARVPADARGSYWALVALESLPEPRTPGARSIGVMIVPRVIVPVIVTVAGTESYDVAIEAFEATRAAGRIEVEPAITVANNGNAAVMITGAFVLERLARGDAPAEEVALDQIEPITALPGTTMTVTGLLPWNGSTASLQAHAYVRYGPRPQDAVEAASTVDNAATPTTVAPAARSAQTPPERP
jgi:hypothetical protein